ncbi:unnamed protein product [Victoria cruziana]
MIYVGGLPFSSSSSSASPLQEYEILVALLEHPVLISASNSFKELPELKISDAQGNSSYKQKHVYVFQREYATVCPGHVDFIGTDEATTCVGLVIRNQKNGITSVAHLDSPRVVALGLNSMLSSVNTNSSTDAELDVHLIGGYEDSSFQDVDVSGESKRCREKFGHSWDLCCEIVKALHNDATPFHIKTLCILSHNTWKDNRGISRPTFHGFLVETSTGLVRPASFDRSSRIPDEIVRRLRVGFSFDDPAWNDRLLETYDTREDKFSIAPFCWNVNWKYHVLKVLQSSDLEVLQICSTSPDAESPEFKLFPTNLPCFLKVLFVAP